MDTTSIKVDMEGRMHVVTHRNYLSFTNGARWEGISTNECRYVAIRLNNILGVGGMTRQLWAPIEIASERCSNKRPNPFQLKCLSGYLLLSIILNKVWFLSTKVGLLLSAIGPGFQRGCWEGDRMY
ncbi:hypothetical protein RF11_15993 [Thelohanellus kitauei]|uniref:Uncharacterized protein n=1 Tax=Thelohanellus kitauei TaxID=669202 RepID=A0A0C2IM88_THEKT|nr:hypothetical protein RF11_15993 [Thelohanellus kitauei]